MALKKKKMSPKLVIGMFGFGTVGGGVVELLRKNDAVKFKKIFVKNQNKKRDVAMPEACVFANSPDEILGDEEINCVVEVMGGTDLAKDVIFGAIKNSKHVVTANKAVVATFVDEIQALLEEKKGKVCFHFEAAVCGGIPIIEVMRRSLVCDEIHSLLGILNGTTNFMLTRMQTLGESFQAALAVAQKKGYAEADPTADVDGLDAVAKLCILAKLAFGYSVKPSSVFCGGIRNVMEVDFQYAKMIDYTIKLLGICRKVKTADGKVHMELAVAPVLVPMSSPLSDISDVTNAVQTVSKNLGSSCFVGPGAGRYPTANSVVADIVHLSSLVSTTGSIDCYLAPPFPSESSVEDIREDFEAEFYVRFIVDDKFGIIHEVSGLFAKHKISIFSILQTPITNIHRVPFVVITEKCFLSQIRSMCDEMKAHRKSSNFSFLVEDPTFMLRIP